MEILITEFKAEEKDELVSFLTGDKWEFHSSPVLTEENTEGNKHDCAGLRNFKR